jgi:hypothetical protein
LTFTRIMPRSALECRWAATSTKSDSSKVRSTARRNHPGVEHLRGTRPVVESFAVLAVPRRRGTSKRQSPYFFAASERVVQRSR